MAWVRTNSYGQSGKNPNVVTSFTIAEVSSRLGSASIPFLAHLFDLFLDSFLIWPLVIFQDI